MVGFGMTVKGIYGLAAVLLLGICSVAAAQGSVKIKDLARFDGVRSQSLVGYGLVVGLSAVSYTHLTLPTTPYV